jgi:hypothetical protein
MALSTTMDTNRRRHRRIHGPFDGTRIDFIDTPVQIYDLSEGGCFVNSLSDQQVGREVELELLLPTEGPVRVIGRTVYARPGFGFAAEFTRISDDDALKLAREIERLAQQRPRG